jgi:hypothetical protein
MSAWLRILGVVVVGLGLGTGLVAGALFARDGHFHEVAAAYARHPDHPIFRAEYLAGATRHYGLLAAAVIGPLTGLVAGSLLLGVGVALRRLAERPLAPRN